LFNETVLEEQQVGTDGHTGKQADMRETNTFFLTLNQCIIIIIIIIIKKGIVANNV